jgi:hydrogenase maturation protease
MAERAGTVVLGLGNPLMADDGFGLAVLARLADDWELPPEVRLVDGGTWGLTLLPDIESAESVLLLDAIDMRAEPGTLARVERDDLPTAYAQRTSPHQIDLSDLLAVATLRGSLPPRIVAIGAQPERIALEAGLSPLLAEAVDAAARLAAAQLRAWGHACTRREALTHA